MSDITGNDPAPSRRAVQPKHSHVHSPGASDGGANAHSADDRTRGQEGAPRISAIVPVTESRYDDVDEIYRSYQNGISRTKLSYEFIYVLDGEYPDVYEKLRRLRAQGEPIRIIKLARSFGEATALNVGFQNAHGDIILTLPAYEQVKGDDLPRLMQALESSDMIIARRWPRTDSTFNRIQSSIFNALQRAITKFPAHDLGCGVRVLKREVAAELHVYGEQHRFLPLLAHRLGFKVRELDAAQSPKDAFRRVHRLSEYLRRIIDLFTAFFLVRFTKKPLRFFGTVGFAAFMIGALATLWLVIERGFFDVPLGNRPMLVIAALFMVLGIQIIAIGLLGELLIFTHAGEIKEYFVEETINN